MCLIIFTPNVRRATIRKTILEKGFKKNNDGAGIAYIENGKIKVEKAVYEKFEDFFKVYQNIRSKVKKGPLLIHFRWGTCGPNNYDNTQPLFIYKDSLVMAHNGVFPSLSFNDAQFSDSYVLAKNIAENKWKYPLTLENKTYLEAICGERSKLVFISAQEKPIIINEKLGRWKGGCWYSDGGKIFKKEVTTHTSTCEMDYSRYSGYNGYSQHSGAAFSRFHHPFGGFPTEELDFGDDIGLIPRNRKQCSISQTKILSRSNVTKKTAESFLEWKERMDDINNKLQKPEIKILPPDDVSAVVDATKTITVPRDSDVKMHQDIEENELSRGRSAL